MKIINVVGARPNFMKIAPLMSEYKKHKDITPLLLHTGQHYDEKMSDLFFNQLNIPRPDIYLNIGSNSHAKQVAHIMDKFEDVCDEHRPDCVLVVGDVNSTMACSLVASKKNIKIVHLEAGLRSYDREMPEEINRIVTDVLADYLLTPSPDANENLLKEGIAKEKIHQVGNIMIDTLINFMPIIKNRNTVNECSFEPKNYILATLHRPSNVDNKDNLLAIVETLGELQNRIPIILPIHPRTQKNILEFKLSGTIQKMNNLIIIPPLGYLDFQNLMMNSKAVITDSGGIQEETTYLKIPCITVRNNTERPVTVTEGSNEIVGFDMNLLINHANRIIDNCWKESRIPEMWDGNTSMRTVNFLKNIM